MNIDDYVRLIQKRMIAVLDYDRIHETERVSYLMRVCGLSRYKARRLLNMSDSTKPRIKAGFEIEMARSLDVSIMWLCFGEFKETHLRTFRIHIQSLLKYEKNDTDKIMRLFAGAIGGHKKASNLLDLVIANQLTVLSAANLL